jgi:hypothetical protein
MIDAEHINREIKNSYILSQNEHFAKLTEEIIAIREFVESFSFLQFGRDIEFMLPIGKPIFKNSILLAVEQTLGSFEACCRLGNFADAYALLRKCRDDFFFHLYITVASRKYPLVSGKESKNIEKWLNNNLGNFHFCKDVLETIEKSENLSIAIQKYELRNSINKIGRTLNNFVHGNGPAFYNKPYQHYTGGELQEVCKNMAYTLAFLVTTFTFLSALCYPVSVMSTDYIDNLDEGLAPAEGSQYWVAPFITEFLEKKKGLLDKNCINFLQNETGMVFYKSLKEGGQPE